MRHPPVDGAWLPPIPHPLPRAEAAAPSGTQMVTEEGPGAVVSTSTSTSKTWASGGRASGDSSTCNSPLSTRPPHARALPCPVRLEALNPSMGWLNVMAMRTGLL